MLLEEGGEDEGGDGLPNAHACAASFFGFARDEFSSWQSTLPWYLLAYQRGQWRNSILLYRTVNFRGSSRIEATMLTIINNIYIYIL